MLTPLYDLEVPKARIDAESGLRSVDEMLSRLRVLDPRPLTVTRPPESRLLGTCRHFATLLCAILRHQCRPARACCGFANYFIPDRYEDHWVCEVHLSDEER